MTKGQITFFWRAIPQLIFVLFLSLGTLRCVSDQSFDKLTATEEEPTPAPPAPEENPPPEPPPPAPPPDGNGDVDVDESETRCALTFTHALSVEIKSADGSSVIAPETTLEGTYPVDIQFGATSLAVDSSDIPDYTWHIPPGDGITTDIYFVISNTQSESYYGPKDTTTPLMRVQNVKYHVDMYYGTTPGAGAPLASGDVEIDLTTDSASGGSWSGTNVTFKGKTIFPKGITDVIGTTVPEYINSQMFVKLTGTLPQDPASVDGTNCSNTGSGGEEEEVVGSGLVLRSADTGGMTELANAQWINLGKVQPNALVVRRVRLKHAGTEGYIPLNQVDLLFSDPATDTTSASGNFFIPSGDESKFSGKLEEGETKDVVVFFYPDGMSPPVGQSFIDGDILSITTGSAAAEERQLYLELTAEISNSAPPLSLNAFQVPDGKEIGYSLSNDASVAVPKGGGQVMIVIENMTPGDVVLQSLSLENVAAGFYLDAQVSAVANTADGIDGFERADCASSGGDYASLTTPCYLVIDSNTSSTRLYATVPERSVPVRAIITNENTAAGASTKLIAKYSDASGKSFTSQIVLTTQ